MAWILFFTSSISPGLCIPFLPSGRHLLLFPFTRWKNLSILLLPFGLSLSPPTYQSCLNASFYPVYSSFWNLNSILSRRQAGFHPERSTLDQILYFSQFISDGLNKPRPGSRTILSTIDFSKAFDSVWHPCLFHKLISAGLTPCFVCWTQSFLSDWRACVVSQNHKSRFFRVRRGVPQGSVLGPVLFSLFINDLLASLPTSVSCCFYADNLAIWSSTSSVPIAVEATQGGLFRLERWSEYWCLPLNPRKCDASFFSVDPHQANLKSHFLLLGSRLRFNSTPNFSRGHLRPHSFFSKHVSSLKAKFFPRLKALRCISASSWDPTKESLSVLYQAFLQPLLTYASPGWFPFLSVTNITKLERLHRAASRAINGCLSSSPIPLPFSEASLPPLRITLTHFTLSSYERALRLPTYFPISGLARHGVKPRFCRSSWRAFASTHPLVLRSTCSREALLAFAPWNLPSFTMESPLSTPCSCSDLPLTRQGAALNHLESLLPHDLVLWTDGSVPFLFGQGGSGVLANCSLCGTKATLSFCYILEDPVCSSFSAEVCAILHALCWSRQHQQVCHFSSLLLLSDSRSVLATLSSPPSFSFYLKLCGRSGRNCLPVLSGYNGSPDTRFSRETTRLMSWPDGERYL